MSISFPPNKPHKTCQNCPPNFHVSSNSPFSTPGFQHGVNRIWHNPTWQNQPTPQCLNRSTGLPTVNGGSGRRWVWLSDVIQHSYRPRICYSNDTEPTDYIYRLIFSINFSYWFFLWPSLNLWFRVARFVPFHLSLTELLSCYNPPLDVLRFKFST